MRFLRVAIILLASILAVPFIWADSLPFYNLRAAGAGSLAFNLSGCNGTSDDAPAINAATAAARSAAGNSTVATTINFPSQAKCNITSASLNFTGFNRGNLIVNCNGATMYGALSGKPVVDALGSTGIRWNDCTIVGDGTSKPTYGIQIGRINTTATDTGGNSMVFNNLRVTGNFTQAACYNFSGEDVLYINPICANVEPNGYEFVQDGFNHFNITSAYVTQLAPVDSPQSFNENTIINGHFLTVSVNGTSPIWSAGTRQHRYINTYAYNASGSTCITLYNMAGGTSQSNDFDVHCEGSALTDIFLITGTQASVTYPSFSYRDGALFASNSVFKLGGSATSASFQDLKIDLPLTLGSVQGTVKMFDAPSAWTVQGGRIYSNFGGLWNAPLLFSGTTILSGQNQDVYNNGVIQGGSGAPAGVVSCTARCLYIRTDGGAGSTLYINETGGGTSGWAAK